MSFAEDLEPTGGRFVERVHHEVQIVSQGAHTGDFAFICPCEISESVKCKV